ncbi:hypothetical protein [Polaromonas sp. CG9_12]|nr:hypothetical protein [Polaromonas sp. CG9_12]
MFAYENLLFNSLANSRAVGAFALPPTANCPRILYASLWITMFTTQKKPYWCWLCGYYLAIHRNAAVAG